MVHKNLNLIIEKTREKALLTERKSLVFEKYIMWGLWVIMDVKGVLHIIIKARYSTKSGGNAKS